MLGGGGEEVKKQVHETQGAVKVGRARAATVGPSKDGLEDPEQEEPRCCGGRGSGGFAKAAGPFSGRAAGGGVGTRWRR